jgi:hypothetical protein
MGVASRSGMPIRRALAALLFALISGCTVTAHPMYSVTTAPPAPRHVEMQPRAGLVWVDGYWQFIGGHWVWRDGYWIRERRGYHWEPGVWVRVGNHYQWRPGHWDNGSRVRRVRVRDHRY